MTEKVEENIKIILSKIKEDGYQLQISKKELIRLINLITLNPYGYVNRLLMDGNLEEMNENVYKIVSLIYKGLNVIQES